jgi:hypothetical protein
LVRWKYCQPFHAMKAPAAEQHDPGDEGAVGVPEMLQLIELFLLFEVEMGGHALSGVEGAGDCRVAAQAPTSAERTHGLGAAAVAQRLHE